MTEQKHNKNRLTLSTNYFPRRVRAEEWVSQAEAARIRGISRQAIARLVKKNRFQILQIGGRVLLRRNDVEGYKAGRPGRPKDEQKSRRN